MKHFSTEEQLIRFLYKETDANESLELLDAMSSDEQLLQQYQRLAKVYRQLDTTKMHEAGSGTIQRILAYSR